MLQKIKIFIASHKVIVGIALVVIAIGAYFMFRKTTANETRYVTTTVEKGNITTTVTGTGQVEAGSQIDLKAKVSGNINYVGVKSGDIVKKGKTLFGVDRTDAEKQVRDAEISLESANLSLEKLKIQNSDANTSADLQKIYDDGFSTVSTAFLDLGSTISGIEDVINTKNLSDNATRVSGNTAVTYRQQAEALYYEAQSVFQKNRADFRLLDRNSSKTDIENIINETYNTTIVLSDAIKSTKNFVDYLAEDTDRASDFSSSLSTLSGYTSKINGYSSDLLSAKTNIKNYKDTGVNSDLDIKSSLLQVEQKQNALTDAQNKLSDYYVYAPFDGVISSVIAKIGDTPPTTLGSIITKQKIATISLNEVDIAKIKLGQKVTLTFDAIDGLTITGEVAEIDSIGTVSQGVVTYIVKISFDTGDDLVKPGMSATATIITDMVQDIIVVPSSAVKTQNGVSYVETFSSPLAPAVAGVQGSPSLLLPEQVEVGIGLVDDTSTEITSGLKEGDIIVTKTITSATTAKTTTQAPSILNSVGGNRAGASAGAMRATFRND